MPEEKKSTKPLPKKTFSLGRMLRIRRGVPITDKMFFARYLALMLRSGIPLTRGLEFLFLQMENPRFKSVISAVAKDITAGVTIADSMEKFPDVFDPLFVNMVRSGETAGNFDEVLDIVAEELEKSAILRSKIVGAMIYPSIIVMMMIAVSIFIVFAVFPRIIKLYESLNVKVPLATRILISVVLFVSQNGKYIAVASLLLVAMFIVMLRTKRGRRGFERFLLTLPLFKVIIRKINTVQFARTFSSLLKSGVPTPEALEVTANTFSNSFYREAVLSLATGVRQGRRMSEILSTQGHWLWPPIVDQMMGVGEETGALTDILKKLSIFFEAEVDNIIDNLTKIIEPVLMIVIGTMVGFIAIATVQLIYSALQGVSST